MKKKTAKILILIVLFLFLACNDGGRGASGDDDSIFSNYTIKQPSTGVAAVDKVGNSSKYIFDKDEEITIDSSLVGSELWVVVANNTSSKTSVPTVAGTNTSVRLYKDESNANLLNSEFSAGLSKPTALHRPFKPIKLNKASTAQNDPEPNSKLLKSQNLSTKLNSSYNVGDKRNFFVYSEDGTIESELKVGNSTIKFKEVAAVLKAKNGPITVTNPNTNKEEKRYILIWADSSLNPNLKNAHVPTDAEYKLIANTFLSNGKTDIYGMVTSVFGFDRGEFNGDMDNGGKMEGYASDLESINVLYTDIDGVGVPTYSYTAGFFGSMDYFPANSEGWVVETAADGSEVNAYKTNFAPMFYMHAYTAGGEYFVESITTLSHEFQHLCHDQW